MDYNIVHSFDVSIGECEFMDVFRKSNAIMVGVYRYRLRFQNISSFRRQPVALRYKVVSFFIYMNTWSPPSFRRIQFCIPF